MAIRKASVQGLLIAALLSFAAASARAASHTWDVNEVFSDPTGYVQFIELVEADGMANEGGVPGHTVSCFSKSFVIPGSPLTPPTTNKFFLMGTADFAALPGAPTPDAIIPATKVPFFSPGGDTIAYQPYDSWMFPAVPTDGTTSRNRNGTTGLNSPTNYAGVTGSVDASSFVPTLSEWGFILFALLLATAGARFVLGSRLAVAVGDAPGGAAISRVPIKAFDLRAYLRLLAVTEGVALAFLLVLSHLGMVQAWVDAAGTLVATAIATYLVHMILRARG